MMTNLFSIFDPSSSYLNLFWISFSIPTFIILSKLWSFSNNNQSVFFSMMSNIKKEFLPNFNNNSYYSILIFIMLFMMIFFSNLYGLFPYIFTSTTHMITCLSMAFPMWSAMILYTWIKSTKNNFAHLIPTGTPFLLMLFMVMIETISTLIRPLTLAIRLMANMTAGHMILSLISSLLPTLSFLSINFIVPQLLLMILEMSVAIIQAYVFTILLTLYFSETK